MDTRYQLIVIGGGAAGFFGAVTAKKADPSANVLLLEKSNTLLAKVRISGGGRCNATHACFDPLQLTLNYPRGGKALIGPFTRFQPLDTIAWFASRGVELKKEADGRMFPISDDSQTIIDCLLKEAGLLGVEIRLKQHIEKIELEERGFCITLASGHTLHCERLLLATGSSSQGHNLARSLGHSIQEPVPSLFTFNVPHSPLEDLSGLAVELAEIGIVDSRFMQSGALLITHWGFSGPAALKLSSWAARFLHEKKYQVHIFINWLPLSSQELSLHKLYQLRSDSSNHQSIANLNPFNLPKNLWKRLLTLAGVNGHKRISEISNESLSQLCHRLHRDIYLVEGKTTYKEEFVTCGGITLDEVNFKTMESRITKGVYFAGEVLDIDAVTGGFNFQNAWTTGWIAGNACVTDY